MEKNRLYFFKYYQTSNLKMILLFIRIIFKLATGRKIVYVTNHGENKEAQLNIYIGNSNKQE